MAFGNCMLDRNQTTVLIRCSNWQAMLHHTHTEKHTLMWPDHSPLTGQYHRLYNWFVLFPLLCDVMWCDVMKAEERVTHYSVCPGTCNVPACTAFWLVDVGNWGRWQVTRLIRRLYAWCALIYCSGCPSQDVHVVAAIRPQQLWGEMIFPF